jgi:hypothetical protein
MKSFGGGLLRRVIPVRPGESTSALLMFAYSFLAMTAWNIVRPLTRSRFIDTQPRRPASSCCWSSLRFCCARAPSG